MGTVFHEMTADELSEQLETARSELRELRFNFAVARSLQNPSRVRKLKRDVARILTVRRERELGLTEVKEKSSKSKGGKAAPKKDTKKGTKKDAGASEKKPAKKTEKKASKKASKKAAAKK